MKRPYIIAINAVSGGGKTVLSRAVHESLPASALYCFDDFGESHVFPEDFYEWWRRGADVAEFDFPGMYTAVAGKIEENDVEFIVLDYPFGRQHERFGKLIDLSVFIDTPLDVAMARRILRDDYEGGIEGLKRELADYLAKARVVYVDAYRAKDECDLVLDGTLALEVLKGMVVERAKGERENMA